MPMIAPVHWALMAQQCFLTQCINQMVLESQLPHKIMNLLFHLIIVLHKLMILWGIRVSKAIFN